MKKIIGLILFIFIFGCTEKKKVHIDYFSDGSIKNIHLSNKGPEQNHQQITFYKNGNIESIFNFRDSLSKGEKLHFYEKNGFLESKIIFNNGSPNGNAYWFYESGALKSSRVYKNGREFDLGFDYWDRNILVNKSLLRFNSKGKVFYKLNFDSTGDPINSEGDSIHSDVIKVK